MASLTVKVLLEALKITAFVFAMMLIMDMINVFTKGRFKPGIQRGVWRQYFTASFLGATPGCLGAFASVSLYVHGGLTFGAMVGGMIATSGDEAFIMLSMFPRMAVLLFALLFVMSVFFAWLTDRIAPLLHIRACENCRMDAYHPEEESGAHYLKQHIWAHIARIHLWRVFLWTFGALLLIRLGAQYCDLKEMVSGHLLWVLVLSGLVGIIPESGPHLIFVMLFAEDAVPFSVLLTSSFVQDGHGLLPLLSYAVKDVLLIKLFNVVFGIGVGLIFYALGW